MGEMRLTDLPVYNAKPTLRVDGRESQRLNNLVTAMDVCEGEGGLSTLDLRLSNWESNAQGQAGYAFEDEALLKLGALIAVYAGDVSGPTQIFEGRITGLELNLSMDGSPELAVLAEDALQRARMQRRIKVHEEISLADLSRTLAGNLSLTPRITGYGDVIGTWVQMNESDLAFLRRLLRRHGGDVQVVGGELHVSPRADVSRGRVELVMGGQLKRVRALADLSHQVTKVSVSGWNAIDGSAVTSDATNASLGPGSGRTGASLLQQAFGEREEHIGHLAAASDGEARALAEAAFAERARRFVSVEGSAEGNPALRVGSTAALRSLSARFDNDYYVTQARHRFDLAEGYRTDFRAECAWLGNA